MLYAAIINFLSLLPTIRGAIHYSGPTCTVEPTGGDDSYAIEKAFADCGHNEDHKRGKVVFLNETYTVARVMNTTYLSNVDIDLKGTLSWDNSNITYWLNNSLEVGYQNQSSAWLFGGANISWQGYGYGTLNGNGEDWYEFINGSSNYPGRPHQITIRNTTNSRFEGIRFIKSQMWTMTVISSADVLLQDIYVNSTGNVHISNTDGADTIYSNNITFRRWSVANGDDSIAMKANSTNILIEDCDFYNGLGVAIGSIGQDKDVYETIQNVTARNIRNHRTQYAGFIKTWTGIQQGYPPNGGGGGLGFVRNITFANMTVHNGYGPAFHITQCTNYEGHTGGCDTSKFNIHDVFISNVTGTLSGNHAVNFDCSNASPCYNINVSDLNVTGGNETEPVEFLCRNVKNQTDFCTA